MEERNRILWPGWETVKLIGRGNFGAVYEIERDMFGETEKAALKVISIPQNESDVEEMHNDGYDDESITSTLESYLKSIVSEYSLMRKMNGCSNVVNCDDIRYVQHEDGIGWDVYIKMELLTSLSRSLPETITDELVSEIAYDICSALELCAKHGVVHRDIKPQNIFLSSNGDYKLGDFGIAKTVEKTMGGTKIGTYKYMAPEVYNNQPYGTSADIYSLGLVLYWLLNEKRMPFLPLPPAKLTGPIEESARQRRLSGEQIPMPAHGGSELKRIVLKACAYEPKNRYKTAKDMKDELRALMYGSPVIKDVLHVSDEKIAKKTQNHTAATTNNHSENAAQMPKNQINDVPVEKTANAQNVQSRDSKYRADVQSDLDRLHREMDAQEKATRTRQAASVHVNQRMQKESSGFKESYGENPQHKKRGEAWTDMSWADLVQMWGPQGGINGQ